MTSTRNHGFHPQKPLLFFCVPNVMLAFLISIFIGLSSGHVHNGSLPTKYDPLRGYYLASFVNPRGTENCSIFWASNEFFLLDGCPMAALQGLEFYIREEKIQRLVDTKFGTLLECSEIFTYEIINGIAFSVVTKDEKDKVTTKMDVDVPVASLVKNHQFSIPKSDILNSLFFNEMEGSSSVYIMNARTFLIPLLKFTPEEGDKVFFWVGNADNGPDSNGIQIPDENNSYEPLRPYNGEMVILTLPSKDPKKKNESYQQMTVYDINYIGLWSPSRQLDYAYVKVGYPDDTMPYFAPPTYYFNQYIIEGVSLCPPTDTYSPTIKYNLTSSDRNCSGDCCYVRPVVEKEKESREDNIVALNIVMHSSPYAFLIISMVVLLNFIHL